MHREVWKAPVDVPRIAAHETDRRNRVTFQGGDQGLEGRSVVHGSALGYPADTENDGQAGFGARIDRGHAVADGIFHYRVSRHVLTEHEIHPRVGEHPSLLDELLIEIAFVFGRRNSARHVCVPG